MSRRNVPQDDLDQSVAIATGEDLDTIRHRGFSLIEVIDGDTDDAELLEYIPGFIDWDELQLVGMT